MFKTPKNQLKGQTLVNTYDFSFLMQNDVKTNNKWYHIYVVYSPAGCSVAWSDS